MPLITGIQKYCIHDGDGIRTTVFFKGCPLSCAWCHNPETQRFERELMQDEERCSGCQRCTPVCPVHAAGPHTDHARCLACGGCVDACVMNLRSIAGQERTLDALFGALCQDQPFYEESGGGVTLSGGEVMCADMDMVEELTRRLYDAGISVMIDTCGHAPYARFQRILPYVDGFLYDIKSADPLVHARYTGKDNALILDNLERLSHDGARIILRIPLIREVNGTAAEMMKIIRFLQDKQIEVSRIHLLPYHDTGTGKYRQLGRVVETGFHAPDEEETKHLLDLFVSAGYPKVRIGG